jgi:hypothetical protein
MVERIYTIGIVLFGLAVFGSVLRRHSQDKRKPVGRGDLVAATLLAVGCLIAGVILWMTAG